MRKCCRALAKVAVAVLATLLVTSVCTGAAGASSPASALPSVIGSPDYRPLDPARIADTRPGRATIDGLFSGGGQVTPTRPLELTVTGRGGVPASGVSAVALNVTATGSTGSGFLTAYPAGTALPLASNVNFDRGRNVANSVIAKVGAGNKVVFHVSTKADVLVDIVGYFTSGGVDAISPARLADTRAGRPTVDDQFSGTGGLSPARSLQLKVTGRGGVPASAVSAVALNVVAVGASSDGYLTVFPNGSARPVASNLNFLARQTVANSVVARVGSGGMVTVVSSSAATDVIVDVVGYFSSGSSYVGLNPQRFADTRPGRSAISGPSYFPSRDSAGVGPIGSRVANGSRIDILVSDRGSVPTADIGAVILNVTVTGPSADGFVTVFPLGSSQPTASSLNFAKGQTVANLAIAKLGRGGGVSIYTSAPSSNVIVDVLGYLPGISTAGSTTTWTALLRDSLDMPISYDRCYPIRYQVNPAGAPTGWVADVVTAFAKISQATGLQFQRLADTNEAPDPDRESSTPGGDYKPVLIAFTTESVIPRLAGDTVGLGGSTSSMIRSSVTFVPERFVTGQAYFDREEAMPTGFGGSSFGQVALHELAHVVGLSHVDNPDEIMDEYMIERSGYFGPGDMEGLGVLYRTQSCRNSPATFPVAVFASPILGATARQSPDVERSRDTRQEKVRSALGSFTTMRTAFSD